MADTSDSGRKFVEKLLKRKGFRDGLAKAQERLRNFAAEELPTIGDEIEAQQSRLTAQGFPSRDDWVEHLLHVCRIVGADPNKATADEIESHAAAWLDREKMKSRLQAEAMQQVSQAAAVPTSLNETEQSIVEAIERLWQRGLEWPNATDIAKESGCEFQTAKNNLAPMVRHGVLESGPSNRGYKVRA